MTWTIALWLNLCCKAGRPYPSKTVKRAIKRAGLEALDEVLDEESEVSHRQ
jgi:hypothetical protein